MEGEPRTGQELVLAGEYDVPGYAFKEPPIILDVGANIGAFSVWAAERWPGCQLFAYEPNPKAFQLLKANVPADAVLRKCAVGLCDGKAQLFEGLHNSGESSLKSWTGEVKASGGVVQVRHASRLPPCDVLKIDTEGSERDILSAYPHIKDVSLVLLEWHSQEDRLWIRELLSFWGFQCVEDREWCVVPPRGIQKWVRQELIHLHVALVTSGRPCLETVTCLHALERDCAQRGWDFTYEYAIGTGVDRARNRSVVNALSTPATHILQLDDDIEFDPHWVINMVLSGFDVTGGAYPRKTIHWELVEEAAKKGVPAAELPHWATSHIYNTVVNDPENGLENSLGRWVQVEEIGTGFLMAKRSVFERMIKEYGRDIAYISNYPPVGETHYMFFSCQRDPRCPIELAKKNLLDLATRFPEYRDKSPQRATGADIIGAAIQYRDAVAQGPGAIGTYLTEDYAFCRLCRMMGLKVWLYVDAYLRHIGPYKFEGRVEHYLKKVEPSDGHPA